MPHGDIMSRVTKKTFRWVLIPSICLQPIMGKGLLRLPPFYAKCLLISACDLWTSLPRAFIDVGVPPNTPSVWYWSKLISWLLLRTVCCFADLFNPSRNDQRVLICLRHWGWSRPCSAHHQWVSGIRFALAQTHPFLSEGKPRISTVLRQTIESFSDHVKDSSKLSSVWKSHGEEGDWTDTVPPLSSYVFMSAVKIAGQMWWFNTHWNNVYNGSKSQYAKPEL